MEWWVEAYDEDKYGASLYLLDRGDPSEMAVGQLVDRGAWWLSQSVGEGYRTEFDSPAFQRRAKVVQVRGQVGRQIKTQLDGSKSPVCLLFWNEPSSGRDPLRYTIASPEPTCDGEQVQFANNLQGQP